MLSNLHTLLHEYLFPKNVPRVISLFLRDVCGLASRNKGQSRNDMEDVKHRT